MKKYISTWLKNYFKIERFVYGKKKKKKKTIYILRHSIPDKTKYKKTPNELEKNKSIEIKEIKKAKEFFEKQEYKNIKNIYTSDYKRTIQTGKILNENIKIDKRLGERIAGTPNYEITPQEYFYKQIKDENYKFIDVASAISKEIVTGSAVSVIFVPFPPS